MNKIIFLILALLIMLGGATVATLTVTNDDHKHNPSAIAEVAPTCTNEGAKAHYKCYECGKLFADAEGKNEIEAPETIAPLGHTFDQQNTDSKYLATAATCTAKATYYKSCSCGAKSEETFESGEALDHSCGSEWTSDVNGHWYVCANGCGVKDSEAAHTPVTSEESRVEATHEAPGSYVEVTKCSACNYEISRETKTIEQIAHTFTEVVDEKYLVSEATCTAKATYYKSCSCGAESTETFEAGELKPHSCELVASGAKTSYEPGESFSTDGLTVSLDCKHCEHSEAVTEYTLSPDGALAVSDTRVTITYGEYSYEISITVAHTHDMAYTSANAATCENAGNNAYYYCSLCGNYYSDEAGNNLLDYETDVVISALNHSWGDVDYIWSENNSVCTATRVCANDSTHVETEQGTVTSVTTDAGCTTDGKTVYTAVFTNSAFEDQTAETAISQTGHSYSEQVTEPTCTADGYTTYTCGNCNDTYTGNTVASSGHSYSDVTTAATCLKDGYITYTCGNCNDTYTEAGEAALGSHTWNGNECSVCGAVKFEAECSEVTQDAGSVGTDNKTQEGANYPSGGLLISGMKNANEFKTVFNIYSDADAEAMLSICLGLREWAMNAARVLKITVNDVEVAIDSSIEYPIYGGEYKYFDWRELEIVNISLKGGQNNVIVIEKREGLGDGTGNGLNFDYISLDSDAKLQWNSEVDKGHTYEWSVTTAPTADTEGVATSDVYCTTCRLYREAQTETLPAVSAENGYVKGTVNSLYTVWSYTLSDGTVLDVEIENPSETYSFMSNVAGQDPFAEYNGGSFVLHENYSTVTGWDSGTDAYNNTYGATFTISLCVEAETTVKLYFVLNNPKADTTVSATFESISLNGTDITSTALVDSEMPATASWKIADQQSVLIANITLKTGTNVITVVRSIDSTAAQGYNNLNIRGIEVVSTIPVELGESADNEQYFLAEANHENDLFYEDNGGSVSVGNYSSTFGWQQTYGATITFKVYSESATTAQLYLIENSTKGVTYVATEEDGTEGAFTSLTHSANGEAASAVTLINSQMAQTASWDLTDANVVLIAEVELQAGVNEFTLVRNSDTTTSVGTNINIWGVKFISDSELSVVKSAE